MDAGDLEVTTAIQASLLASELCQRVQKELVGEVSWIKNDRSPVTVADYGSQAVICKIIREAFRQDTIIAEEDAQELRKPTHLGVLEQVANYVRIYFPRVSTREVCDWIDSSSHSLKDRFWALDPIDGTKGFLRGDQYAIALALVEKGIVTLGVLACPNLHQDVQNPESEKGCLFLARRGKGSVQMDLRAEKKRPLAVSKVATPSDAFFTESVEAEHADHLFHERLAMKLNIWKPPLRIDSQAKYGLVARGEAILYLRIPAPTEQNYKEKIWDHAAGALLAEEAGGKVTDAFGKPLDFRSGIKMERNYGIVVTNGLLHDAVLKALHPLPIEQGG